jgi:integrase
MARVEETLRLLSRGRLNMPGDVDPAAFILSDGRLNAPRNEARVVTVGRLLDEYSGSLPEGAKEASTRKTEGIHVGHLRRHLTLRQAAGALSTEDLQRYANARLKESGKAGGLRPDTVRKELATLRFIWNWAAERAYAVGRFPLKGVLLPKSDEKPPFMTWGEVERTIARGGVTEAEERELWGSLFLTRVETAMLLDHVKQNARHTLVHPMFFLAAHTGARISEVLRSRIDDIDFHTGMFRVREKKKTQKKGMTYRFVPMSAPLRETLSDWLELHPGGQSTIATTFGDGVTPEMARHHFHQTVKGSKWSKLRGFHVLRHSFASNLAACGVDQRVIDEWLGHQTDEMRRRYRHLFPDQQRSAIDAVFPGDSSTSHAQSPRVAG